MATDKPKPIRDGGDDEDDDYVSADDEDFAPDDGNLSSDSGSEAGPAQRAKPQESPAAGTSRDHIGTIGRDEVAGLMQDAGQKRSRAAAADGDGGDGGFIQTRSMAAAQPASTAKPLASVAGANLDVDAMWAALSSTALAPLRAEAPIATSDATLDTSPRKPAAAPAAPAEDLVEVTETYEFAGELHTRTTRVPRGEAPAPAPAPATPTTLQKRAPSGALLYRPLRRISAFEPNPTGTVRGLPRAGDAGGGSGANAEQARKDSKNKNKTPRHQHAIPRVRQPTRLNVVDKSKLDWQKLVDATGAREELDAAQRSKDAYLARRDFLERVEDREEEQRAAARAR